jgi:UDP-3-O-[3-hydroxymyristoyl] N-acetylglucosamine deacetylase
LRFSDEFVRHKIIDFVGDLYLAGAPIIGEAQCACSGHALNHKLLAALFADERAWCWSDMTAEDIAHHSAPTWAEPAVAHHA